MCKKTSKDLLTWNSCDYGEIITSTFSDIFEIHFKIVTSQQYLNLTFGYIKNLD